jgi:hypothetical protein
MSRQRRNQTSSVSWPRKPTRRGFSCPGSPFGTALRVATIRELSAGSSWITALESVSSANALLFSTFQINLCSIALHNNCCSERPREISQPFEDVSRLLAHSWLWQAACRDEGAWRLWKTIRVVVLCVYLALAHLVQHYRPELNRPQILSLEFDGRDYAFPDDRFQKLCRFC